MVAPPIKRLPDTLAFGSDAARADANPHVTGLATGNFFVGWDDPVSATNIDARWVSQNELFSASSFGTAANSTASNETQIGMDTLASGDIAFVWFMGAGHMIGSQSLGNLGGYSLLGVGDFNGDHTSDLVWRNNMSGVTETWQMQQGVRTGGSTLGNLAGYQLLDTGDLNHDGTDDIVWRASTGATSSWAMRNGQFQNDEQPLGNFSLATFAAPVFGDFTGDGGKDVLFLRAGNNTTTILDIEHHSLVPSDFLIV
jgi:hypothetical protein